MTKARKIRIGLLSAALAAASAVAWAQMPKIPATPPMAAADAAKHSAWDFNLVAIDGEPLPLKKYKGQVVLLVNTASFCGYTPQYDGLSKTYSAYKPKGFTIVGVPSGDFADQEYKTNGEIKGFCSAKGVKFPLAEKADVVGPNAIPIYKWAAAKMGADNTPKWNFHKYLIGRNGQIVAVFPSKIEPSDPAITAAIEKALAAKA